MTTDNDDNNTNNKVDKDDGYQWWWQAWLWLMTMMGMTASDNEDEDNKVGTELLLELLVEFISRPVSHTFSQVGTELLTLTVPHVM